MGDPTPAPAADPEPAYKAISIAKRKERDSKIPPEWRITLPEDDDNLMDLPRQCGIFTAEELEITETKDSVELLAKIHSGQYTSLAVTKAFCKRAAVAQQALNCLTEISFSQAYARASYLDAEFQRRGGRPIGPLHGLPVSLKDSLNVAGIDSTIGMTGYAFQPEKENSVIVDILLQLGAVMYVKTNVPQSMMTPDTQNWVFGPTRNPRSKYITAAGSSGGLGALIAFRGSLMGIGTDVGGSVRIPAYCNGVYGVKPSSGRLPYHNLKGYLAAGAETVGILCVNGVIASSTRDCALLLKAVSEAQPWLSDPSCAYLPWPSTPLLPPNPKLTIGVIWTDHETTLLPPIHRILSETVSRLQTAGHETLDIPFHLSAELSQNALDNFKIDGGTALAATMALTDEPYTQAVKDGGLYPCPPSTLTSLYAYSATRADLQHSWLRFWASTAKQTRSGKPIDAILTPAQASVPRPHETLIRSHFSRNFNVLDYPGMVVQCGRVDLERDGLGGEELKGEARGVADERVRSIYTPEKRARYKDYPIGLQLVGQRQQEAKLMEIALILDDLVKEAR